MHAQAVSIAGLNSLKAGEGGYACNCIACVMVSHAYVFVGKNFV